MSAPVATALPHEPVRDILDRMVRRQIVHMPVVDNGVPVGMVARHDLLKAAARVWDRPQGGDAA